MSQYLRLKFPLLLAFAAALGLLATTAGSALAHARVEVGSYVMIIGWENEPPVVGDRNFLTIDITRDEVPIEDVEATLDLRIVYGDKSITANLNPTSTPGHYRVDIYPTVRGEYTLQFNGMIEDTAVDLEARPEEVLPAAVVQFPEASPDTVALQSQVDDLTAQLQTARTMGIAGIAVGVLGVVIGVVAIVLKRSK